jgi:hypothetical protein
MYKSVLFYYIQSSWSVHGYLTLHAWMCLKLLGLRCRAPLTPTAVSSTISPSKHLLKIWGRGGGAGGRWGVRPSVVNPGSVPYLVQYTHCNSHEARHSVMCVFLVSFLLQVSVFLDHVFVRWWLWILVVLSNFVVGCVGSCFSAIQEFWSCIIELSFS